MQFVPFLTCLDRVSAILWFKVVKPCSGCDRSFGLLEHCFQAGVTEPVGWGKDDVGSQVGLA